MAAADAGLIHAGQMSASALQSLQGLHGESFFVTSAEAKAPASPGGTRMPVTPSCTISGVPPDAVATTGLAIAIERGNGRQAAGCSRLCRIGEPEDQVV